MRSLDEIYEEYAADPNFAHLRLPSTRLVPGTGSSSASFFLVGEAPGATENTQGRPFCGSAGRVLDQLMHLAGIRVGWTGKQTGLRVIPGCAEGIPPNAFITNVVKYRPPNNRTPSRDEIERSRPYLIAEYNAVGNPDVLIGLGSVAKTALGGPAEPISKIAGKPVPLRGGRFLWPMYRPSFGLRNPVMRPVMETHWLALGEWIRGRT